MVEAKDLERAAKKAQEEQLIDESKRIEGPHEPFRILKNTPQELKNNKKIPPFV